MLHKGDLVSFHSWDNCDLIGVVLTVEQMEGIYRDSQGTDPIYSVTVLFNDDVPTWLGEGKICTVSDSILQVISETG